jgi:Uma2 family endonuclease
MAMPAMRRRWTAAEVRALMRPERPWPRYELIAGALIVTPAPGWAHQIAVTELWSLIDAYLTRTPVGVAITSPADLELRPGTVTQPDVFVVPADMPTAADAPQWSDIKALLLAVEVSSPGTGYVDRGQKRDLYLASNVAEYWIVDLDARAVERWTRARGSSETAREQLVWRPGVSVPSIVDLPAFFDRVAAKLRMFSR